jgi:membrane protein DedA with SNARE-associated domain
VGERPLVARFGRYLLITQSDIDRAERFLAGRGVWAIPVGRALPVVRTFVSIVAGFVEVPVMMFALLSLVGTAIWVTAISLLGYAVGTQWKSIEKGISLAGYAIAVVVVIGIVAFVWHRLREVRREGPGGVAGPREHQPKHRSPTA